MIWIGHTQVTHINDVVIIPDIDHRYLGIGHAKQALGEPHRVSVEVELFQLILQL